MITAGATNIYIEGDREAMQFEPSFPEIRDAVQKLCSQFPGEYWSELDEHRRYPQEFVSELTESGFLSVLIPEQYGGVGLWKRPLLFLRKFSVVVVTVVPAMRKCIRWAPC